MSKHQIQELENVVDRVGFGLVLEDLQGAQEKWALLSIGCC